MLTELTAEQRVTEILASHHVLKKQEDLHFENDVENLGKYLKNAPKFDILEDMNIKRVKPSDPRFAFVSTSWKI